LEKTVYTLTYRIPVKKPEYMQECNFRVIENNFGPISTAYMSLYLPGHGNKNMVYATNPELMPSGGMNLKSVQVNKYFKNSCVKRIYFYEMPYKQITGKKIYAHTPEGRGRVSCVGSPKHKVPFICGYPTNDFIPKNTYDQYTLEITDNQTLPRFGRFQSINYKLLNNKKKNVLLSQTGKRKRFSMIMRYKVIDASAAPVKIITIPTKPKILNAQQNALTQAPVPKPAPENAPAPSTASEPAPEPAHEPKSRPKFGMRAMAIMRNKK